MTLRLRETTDGVELWLRVHPRASRSEVRGVVSGELDVSIAAPPVDGEANEELVRFLAKLFDVPKRSVEIVSGSTGKHKRLLVRGVSAAHLTTRLGQ